MAELLPEEEHARLLVRLRAFVPGANLAECKTCRAPIFWAAFASGRVAPVDVEPVEDGNLRLTGVMRPSYGTDVPEITVVSSVEGQGSLLAEPRFVSHFATCPDADEHRRGG